MNWFYIFLTIKDVENYLGTKQILIQLSKNAWDYADGIENQKAQVAYLNDTIPDILNLPNVVGSILHRKNY